jgi:cytochrome c
MHNVKYTLLFLVFIAALSACNNQRQPPHRPLDPWVFRSVLDRKPRMLTIALDSSCYVAYDLQHCGLYKAWKGGVLMEGTAYTDKKNVQPTSWGTSYVSDSTRHFEWVVTRDGQALPFRMQYKGHVFSDEGVTLNYALLLSSGDTLRLAERPEFIRSGDGKPGLERTFTLGAVPAGVTVALHSSDGMFRVPANATSVWSAFFPELPRQYPPKPGENYDHRGRYWMEKSDCLTCHEPDRQTVGPSFMQIAQKYPKEKSAVQHLIRKVKEGGSGVWGATSMTPHPSLKDSEINEMLNYIFTLKPKEERQYNVSSTAETTEVKKDTKPGYGAALEGVHPSFDVQTIHNKDFQPKVGGLAFMPDGRLLVTTWDKVGGVYALSGVESADTSKISVKRIASGLAEPLGITVVNGDIYVLQKHELTKLIDLDGDGVTDEYQVVCNAWTVSSDFHEFAFGLVYRDGYFYATLSMAMRLMSGEKQKADRGKTIRISPNGTYEAINYGLRTPNGIGMGPDNEIFVTDNQGEWLPANKLIHVKKGEFLGMHWNLPDTLKEVPPVAPPAIWLPENEIGNSPSQPVLIPDGPYKGQMLHGDVTHGGIKRDFLEKVNGEYQGAVFRFTQGLEAGVNRLCYGPDDALYIGGVGMVGGWSWKEKKYGLQRMVYNGKPTFEMLAVRARPNGFEIEFTEPLKKGQDIRPADFSIQQWYYVGTANYGGPKLDLRDLPVRHLKVSDDRKHVYLTIDGLKEGHVVYFNLSEDLQSEGGRSLWSSEAWYTLNNIPEEPSL